MTVATYVCPNDGPFDAEAEERVSQSSYEVPVVDGAGQHPTMGDQVAAANVGLTRDQWEALAAVSNPSWTPTHDRVLADPDLPPQTHLVAVCPTCGSPIKVG